MHLLVLSAFRRSTEARQKNRWDTSQCTFWCSVLSDQIAQPKLALIRVSQCTFWCSVLSDPLYAHTRVWEKCLNAPFGAQCFPTLSLTKRMVSLSLVSMHLLVLSAFRPAAAWCFSGFDSPVSMHLLVLSAFRLEFSVLRPHASFRLNAPFGAQCFPTHGF